METMGHVISVETEIISCGVRLVRRTVAGPRGGRGRIYQAATASRTWGYWYTTAAQAARRSNETDRVVRADR